MVVYCYIIIYAMLCYSYFTFILTVDALQRLEELRRFAESQAYVSQMQLAASCWSRCLVVYHWILYSDAYNAHDTDDTYYDHCHPCEILWNPVNLIWFGCFQRFPCPLFCSACVSKAARLLGFEGILAAFGCLGNGLVKGLCQILRRSSQLHLGPDTDHATVCRDWHPEAKSNGTPKWQVMSKCYLKRADLKGIVFWLLLTPGFRK